MSAKISLSFGNRQSNILRVEKAQLFFLGCTDALVELGLFEYNRLVDLVEVIRVYPNQGIMTEGQIVVEVVTFGASIKKNDHFIVQIRTEESIRELVKSEVVRIANELVQRTKRDLHEQARDLYLKLDKPPGRADLGTNGGVKCDAPSGPCACGAWH